MFVVLIYLVFKTQPLMGRLAVLSLFRATVVASPPQHGQVAIIGRIHARQLIPWANISSSPLQNVKVAILGRIRACSFVPRTIVISSPFQNIKMAI